MAGYCREACKKINEIKKDLLRRRSFCVILIMLRLYLNRMAAAEQKYTLFTSVDLRSMPVTLEVVRRKDADRWRENRRKWR